ncbi:MAG TPA: methionine--tRNA ligase [Candidatus Acidoferrum sp.]|nr:methionine--tRNA ligase [Candidatus Acidoferrum sp.]
MGKYIITAALPYAYSVPHLGNFVGSILPADVYHRYLKMKEEDVIFICGSDQHGTPTELAAIKAGVEPEVLANLMHEKIKKLFMEYECSFTYYGKTHTHENKEVVYDIFKELYKNGYLLERDDLQAYCNVDKRVLTDRLVQGTCPYCGKKSARGDQCDNCGKLLEPKQIIGPFCAICGKSEITFVKTKNLALELNKLQDNIGKFIKKNSKNNWSKDAVNKSLSMIKEGLKPRDITRSMKWGFPVPLAGYENSVIYVWVTGLIGYIGITKEWNSNKWQGYWQNEHTKLIQFFGKDNTIFHTIIWPGMAIGSKLGFILPYTIKESQFLNSKTFKFSKSQGVGLNMETALEILEPDYWRFILMYLYPETADTEFSEDLITQIVNGVMNDNIGNFINRVLKLSKENEPLIDMGADPIEEHVERAEKIVEKYKSSFDNFSIREALQAIVELSALGNAIMGNSKPWATAKLAKTDKNAKKELSEQMVTLLGIAHHIGILMWPFTPSSSMKILSYFDVEKEPTLDTIGKKPKANLSKEITPIFKKLDDSFAKNFQK